MAKIMRNVNNTCIKG